MQRLFNVNKWVELNEGKGVTFPGDRPRVVRLEVNSPGETFLYIHQDNDDASDDVDTSFLARVCGRDTLEFHVSGKFSLSSEGPPCNIYTVDGDNIAFENLTPTIFTKIAERRARNPELEYIAAKMQANMERRLEQQAHELKHQYRLDAERAERARAALPAPEGVAGDAGPPPEQDGDGADGEDPPAARKGRKGKGGAPEPG